MPDTITIRVGCDSIGRTIEQTLTVGDRVVIESVSRSPTPSRRIVAVVTRILGGSRSPYMEVRRPDGRLQLFTEAGTERGRYSVSERLRPFVSVEAAHAAAVKQYEHGQQVAYKLSKALEQAHLLVANHPELIADYETLLKRIADVTAPKS